MTDELQCHQNSKYFFKDGIANTIISIIISSGIDFGNRGVCAVQFGRCGDCQVAEAIIIASSLSYANYKCRLLIYKDKLLRHEIFVN